MANSVKNENQTVAISIPPIKEEIREHLVTTAVKFLLNPKVRTTTLANKQGFLRKKGLTEEEIDLACHQANAYDDNINTMSDTSKMLALQQYPASSRTSLLLKAMDVANMIALISIGSYSLYSLWKNYIAPRIFGTRSRLEQKYERLLESITQLNQNVVELRELFKEMQLQSLASSSKSFELQEVRKEIGAIKSLLLGQNQFPSPTASTGIPSWQMVGEGGDISTNENSDESSSRRRPKKDKSERMGGGGGRCSNKGGPSTSTTTVSNPDDSLSERGDEEIPEEAGGPIRKHPSLDSNNGFNSGSSCEVVFVGKNDSSDPDHSDD